MALLNCCFQSGQQTPRFKLLIFQVLLVITALGILHFISLVST